MEMLICPKCGATLQTLDSPCPECLLEDPATHDASSLHEYSRTFYNRTAYRYRPAVLADGMSRWLSNQDGLLGVNIIFHRDLLGLTGGATATCQASHRLTGATFRLTHIALARGLSSRRRTTPGDALNEWAARRPAAWRLHHWIFGRVGVPIELWILYADGTVGSISR
jgi:hypothetical protein